MVPIPGARLTRPLAIRFRRDRPLSVNGRSLSPTARSRASSRSIAMPWRTMMRSIFLKNLPSQPATPDESVRGDSRHRVARRRRQYRAFSLLAPPGAAFQHQMLLRVQKLGRSGFATSIGTVGAELPGFHRVAQSDVQNAVAYRGSQLGILDRNQDLHAPVEVS